LSVARFIVLRNYTVVKVEMNMIPNDCTYF
jgi:hypothetical protein